MKHCRNMTVTVSGQVQLYQASKNEQVDMRVLVHGLTPPGPHGFHLHRDGSTNDDCKAAGPHFNPFNVICFFHILVSKF
jgi:Cu-Zn family superoxide dismutase